MLERFTQPTQSSREDTGLFGFSIAHGVADALLLIARVLPGYVFLMSGWGKLMNLSGFASFLGKQGVPYAFELATVGAAVEFAVGLALILGIASRYTALLAILFVIVATGIAHRFWEVQGAGRMAESISFNKNMAMIGGLLAIFVAGPGRLSLDRLFVRKRS